MGTLAPVVDIRQVRERRKRARHEILDAANRIRRRHNPQADRLGMKHIQRAVCIVRFWGAVGDDTLRAAGYRTPRRRGQQPTSLAERLLGGEAA